MEIFQIESTNNRKNCYGETHKIISSEFSSEKINKRKEKTRQLSSRVATCVQ